MKKLHYIFISLLFCSFAHGQINFNFQEINQLDGLPKGLIFDLEEDDKGFIWVAMTTGLFRYDGSQFEQIEYPTNNGKIGQYFFRNILKDSKGNIWAGTISNGLFHINLDQETATQFLYDANDSVSLADNQIGGIYEDEKGRVWISTRKEGFCLFEPKTRTFKRFKPDQYLDIRQENINKIFDFTYQKPFLWLATGNGLVRFHPDKNEWKYFAPCTVENTVNPQLLNGYEEGLRNIFIQNDTLWMGTRVGGLIAFDLKTERCLLVKNPKGKESKWNSFSFVAPYQNDLFWVFNNNNLKLFNKSKLQFTTISPSNLNTNLNFISVYKILKAKNGTLWISNRNTLVKTKNRNPQFKQISFPTTLYTGFKYPKQPLIFASSNNAPIIYIYDTLTKKIQTASYQPHSPRTKNYVSNFLFNPIEERLYIVESTDIYYWDEQNQSIRLFFGLKDYLVSKGFGNFDGVTSSTVDSRGNIWIGTKFEGIVHINPFTEKINHYYKEHQNPNFRLVHNSWISDIKCDSKGRIWYVSEKGFGYYNHEIQSFINYPVGSYQTSNPSIILNDLSAVGEDSLGRIWLGSQNGGIGYFDPNATNKIIQTYDDKGLRSNKVIKFFNDNQSDLWLLHDQGFSKINSTSLEVANFGSEYDVTGAYRVNQSQDGETFKSQEKSLLRFFPKLIQPQSTDLKLYFKQFQVFDERLSFEQPLSEVKQVNLTYRQNFFAIEYGAIHFQMPHLIQYAYKLDGVDDQWNFVQQRNRASYTNINGGHYTFRIKAKMENGDWSPEIQLPIYIRPPYWQTWWFYALIILIKSE